MPDKHLSSQFDVDLNGLCSKLLEMGGLVELQISNAMRAFTDMNVDICNQVIQSEKLVNDFEIQIDLACTEFIARRQPTARDLRLVMAISKAITNLERAGDEAERVAKRTKRLIESDVKTEINVAEIKLSGQMAISLLRRSLDAFARLDVSKTVDVARQDEQVDEQFRAAMRQLITFTLEDPRTISMSLEVLFVAKAIERIGDHAKNIAEYVVYMVKGKDVRHTTVDEMERETLAP